MASRDERRNATATRWLVLPLLLALPGASLAQDRPDGGAQPPAEAKSHFERGREHFRAGRYREAIVELKAALELDPGSPTLMYNVAYANELLGEIEEAIAWYRRYLDALPASAHDEREKTRLTLRRLEGFREQVAAEPEPEPQAPEAAVVDPAPGEPPEPGVGRADALFWITLGGGVAMLGGGAAAGLLALDREDDVAQFVVGEDGSIADRSKLLDEADRLALASDLLIGGGAALVTAATLLFFLRAPEPEQAAAPRVLIAGHRGGALLGLRGSF